MHALVRRWIRQATPPWAISRPFVPMATLRDVGVFRYADEKGEPHVCVVHAWGQDHASFRQVIDLPHRLGDGCVFGNGADDAIIDPTTNMTWHHVRKIVLGYLQNDKGQR